MSLEPSSVSEFSLVVTCPKGGNELIIHQSLIAVILLTFSLIFNFLEVCCPIPDLKNDGQITEKKTSAANSCPFFKGDAILYTCYKKYTFEATCQPDGTWYPKTPTCDESKSFWICVILDVSLYQSDGD